MSFMKVKLKKMQYKVTIKKFIWKIKTLTYDDVVVILKENFTCTDYISHS